MTGLTRRELLKRWAVLGAAASSGRLVTACGRQTPAADSSIAGDVVRPSDLDCADVSGLTEPEIRDREIVRYVEESTVEGQVCANCAQWTAPTRANECGACDVVAGPINPVGYCLSWAPLRS